jgi:hypothetical protein
VLSALQAETRRLAVKKLVLETGVRQPDSLALYERAGFAQIPAFGR